MKTLLVVLLALQIGCADRMSTAEARKIAATRLSERVEPSQSAAQIEASLSITQHGVKHIVEFHEDTKNLMWAVIVKPDGSSEVSRIKIRE